MNKLIVPTGYMGSGSSAITDLISEFEDYTADYGSYEYVFLHCPNGVFDLEDKLLCNNNAVRSDEAIHTFRMTMKQLYDKKYWWVGHYKEVVDEKFWDITEEYIESLIEFRPQFYWYYQENCNLKMIIQLVIKRIVSTITLGKVSLPKPLLYNDMCLSYVNEEEFYQKTKVYLNKVWKLLGIDDKNVILDQLVLPFNTKRIHKYFDSNAYFFIVERDPRDVFILNKYIWAKRNMPIPYPTEVEGFCECYDKLRKMEPSVQNNNVHRIHFEDLIYKYEESVDEICDILKVSLKCHVYRKEKFNPDVSINNTQLFVQPQYASEIAYIEQRLSKYLYKFPYEHKVDLAITF